MPPLGQEDTAASRRDSINAAFEKLETDKPEEEEVTPTPQELMDSEEPEEEVNEEEPEPEEEEEDGDSESTEESEESDEEEQQTDETSVKPPASWGPKAKADWKKVPAHLQAEITRRERDYSVGIQKNAESAKLGEGIKQVLAPYAHFMAAEGADEIQAVQNLARHAGIMRSGTNLQKAQTVAQIISQYGVDISMLDSMLAGEQVDESTHQISQLLEQRLGPIEQMLQQGQQTVVQSVQQNNQKEIEKFSSDPKNEFFDDVRDQMADIVEIRASQGKDCTLQEAYDIATMMNPEIQEIPSERKKQEALRGNQNKIQNKQNAAVSVKSSNASANPGDKAPASLRDQISSAWDQTEGDTGGRI